MNENQRGPDDKFTGVRQTSGKCRFSAGISKKPHRSFGVMGFFGVGCLAVTYFRERSAHYHWRSLVSRSCSGWEGVGPRGYCRQAKGVVWCGLDIRPYLEKYVSEAFGAPKRQRFTSGKFPTAESACRGGQRARSCYRHRRVPKNTVFRLSA